MAWNKDTYYYQNQMKVLSGTDPEPGYTEDDTNAAPSNIEERISTNGLYKFVSLIKDKFDKVKNAIYGAWRLADEEHDLNNETAVASFLDSEGAIDLNKIIAVGNYGFFYDSSITIKNKPTNKKVAFTLKVSHVKDAQHHLWQDFLTRDGHRWYRYGWDNNPEDGVYSEIEWGPWMLVLTHQEDPNDPIDPDSKEGTADDIFLKRKNDFTNGSIGFGKDPAIDGEDISKRVKAKIVLGDYSYGKEEPSTHYSGLDTQIPKGQIYLQYFDDQTES